MSLPRATANLEGLSRNSLVSSTSRKYTVALDLLATSRPIADLPGIGASILIPVAARFIARSSARFTILLTLTPEAG